MGRKTDTFISIAAVAAATLFVGRTLENLRQETPLPPPHVKPPEDSGPLPEIYHNARVNLSGVFHLQDYETFGSNETGSSPFSLEFKLGPDHVTYSTHTIDSICVGDEVWARLKVTSWFVGNAESVVFAFDGFFYEGTDCGTDDLDGWQSVTMVVDVGQFSITQPAKASFQVKNWDEDEERDKVEIDLAVSVQQVPN